MKGFDLLKEYFDLLFGSSDAACSVALAETDELVYINRKMQELLGDRPDIIGEKFYNIIQHNTDFGQELPVYHWDREKIHCKQIYDKKLGMSFNASITPLNYEGTEYLFVKFASLDEKTEKDFQYELAMSQCAALLLKSESPKMKGLLALLGEYYQADKTYLFDIDNTVPEVTCRKFWVKDKTETVVQSLSTVTRVQALLDWCKMRNEVNMVEVDETLSDYNEDALGLDLLKSFQIHNIVIYVFEDGFGMPTSVLAVTNRRNKSADFRLLQGIARFLEMGKCDVVETVQELNDRDMLTGFYSRISYSQKVDFLCENPPKKLGVVFANINGLKQVNSEFGYAKGDSYIKKSSIFLANHFETDFYRISGDEFVGFFPDVEKEAFEEQVIAIGEDMIGSDHNYFALGHAWGSGTPSAVDLVKEADMVMYINKQEYYHESHRSFLDIKDSTLSDLLSYLENDEFMIYLQPQVQLEDGSLYGAEALIRRFDKTNKKMVFPDQFIPLYEKKSVIRHVDIFVVEQVCRLLSDWCRQGKELPVSVNLSRVTLLEYGIVDTIAKICDKYGVPRHLLVIEVTERVGLVENNVASTLIKDFVKQGFHISLDDFGCAYSNIVTLAQIDVNEVKLDKSLVDDVVSNHKNRVLVRNVLRMCNELEDTSTLAEGIEEQAQGELLYSFGCRLGQGYFYSRPIPVNEFCEKYMLAI